MYNELKDITDLPVEDNDKMEQRFMKIVEEEFGGLGWFHKDIMSRWIVMGSYKAVSVQTKIPITSIGNYIREAKEEIKHNVFKRIKDE